MTARLTDAEAEVVALTGCSPTLAKAVVTRILAPIEAAIAAQESCASPPNTCYRDHDGCFVADSLAIVRAVLQHVRDA
jgi:hypothetical protein